MSDVLKNMRKFRRRRRGVLQYNSLYEACYGSLSTVARSVRAVYMALLIVFLLILTCSGNSHRGVLRLDASEQTGRRTGSMCATQSALAVVTTYRPERLKNLETIVPTLLDYCMFAQVVIWNNNPKMHLKAEHPKVRVINSKTNIGTHGKYQGCLAGDEEHCYIIDDDWLPMHIQTLYQIFVEGGAELPVILTDAITQSMDMAQSISRGQLHTGFAWLGVGSFISRKSAAIFMKYSTQFIPKKFVLHSDIFFTLFLNRHPLVLSSAIVPLEGNSMPNRMSNAQGYESFMREAKMKAFATVMNNSERFQFGWNSSYHLAEERAICADGRIVTDSVRPYERQSKFETGLTGANFLQEKEEYRETVTKHPYYFMCDGDDATSFRPLEVSAQEERRIGLKFLQKQRFSVVRLSITSRVGANLPTFSIFTTTDGGMWKPVENLNTLVTHKLSKNETHYNSFILRFTFSSVYSHAVTFRAVLHHSIDLHISEMITFADAHVDEIFTPPSALDLNRSRGNEQLDQVNIKVAAGETRQAGKLLVVVSTSAGAHARRQNVRDTIGHLIRAHEPETKLVFVIGSTTDTAVDEEAVHFGDIIMLDTPDGYGELSFKTLKLLQWASQCCQEFDAMMKIDDDSYVQLDLLRSKMKENNYKYFYWGHMFDSQPVYHDKKEKNYEPYYEGSLFPRYASGSGYILSMSLVHYLAYVSALGPGLRMLRNEDAAIGLWLTGLNVTYIHDATFWPEPPAQCVSSAILLHRQSMQQMTLLHHGKMEGDICKYI